MRVFERFLVLGVKGAMRFCAARVRFWRGEQHEAAIKAEIAARVHQLRTLDVKIKRREAEAGL